MSHVPSDLWSETLALRAEGAISAVRTSLVNHEDDDIIQTNARSLRNMAALVEELSRCAATLASAERTGCNDPDCMSRTVDGVRTWVPMPQFEAARLAAAEAVRSVERFREGLRNIAEQPLSHAPEHALLCDWEGVALSLQRFAAELLSPPPPPPAHEEDRAEPEQRRAA